MLQKVFTQALSFFGAIATSLTGLGAVCTALGFLAEHQRWEVLGLAGVPPDLNAYVYTGARFLALLPSVALGTLATAATANRVVGLLILLVLAALLGHPLVKRFLRQWLASRARVAQMLRRSIYFGGLAVLAFLQFIGAHELLQVAEFRDLLFAARPDYPLLGCLDPGFTLLEYVLFGCSEALRVQMGEVFLIAMLSGLSLWLLFRLRWTENETGLQGTNSDGSDGDRPATGRDAQRAKPAAQGGTDGAPVAGADDEVSGVRRGPGEGLLLAVNAALLALQLLLLPINYGVLFLPHEFPVVRVTLVQPALRPSWPDNAELSLLQRQGDELYLYSPYARRIWLVPRSDTESVVFLGLGNVFGPLEDP